MTITLNAGYTNSTKTSNVATLFYTNYFTFYILFYCKIDYIVLRKNPVVDTAMLLYGCSDPF